MPIDPKNLSATATITFREEFNSLSLWDGSAGRWRSSQVHDDPRGSGGTLSNNGELQWYINSMYPKTAAIKPWAVSNGILTLTAHRADRDLAALVSNHRYVSGHLNSFPSFSQTYGYFEMSAKLPKGKGLWPAFWLLPTDRTWPPEIDVMEVLGHDTMTLQAHMHSNAGGKRVTKGKAIATPDLSAGFHTYGVDWQVDHITWYFDGREVFQVDTPPDLHKPMYLLVNLAVGGNWPGSPNFMTPFPANYRIDYIRVYKAKDAAVAREPAPACTVASQLDVTKTLAFVGVPQDLPAL
jgi:beta-glucanase (GH16 family)